MTIDVGANLGVYAYELARLVGRGGRVHAFEPDPGTIGRLTAMSHSLPQITVHAMAASDHAGEMTLHVPVLREKRIGALASLVPPAQSAAGEYENVAVRVERIDTVLSQMSGVALVKIDVEGHEMPVLRGAEGTLRRHRPALMIEIEQRHIEVEIATTFAYIGSLGYDGYAIGPQGIFPLSEFDVRRDQLAFLDGRFVATGLPRAYVNNFLFVRSGSRVDDLPRQRAR